jgi:hypothetical protein
MMRWPASTPESDSQIMPTALLPDNFIDPATRSSTLNSESAINPVAELPFGAIHPGAGGATNSREWLARSNEG